MISSYIFLVLGATALSFGIFFWLRLARDIKNKKFDWRIIFDAGAYVVPETMAQLYNIYLGLFLTLIGVAIIWLNLALNDI